MIKTTPKAAASNPLVPACRRVVRGERSKVAGLKDNSYQAGNIKHNNVGCPAIVKMALLLFGVAFSFTYRTTCSGIALIADSWEVMAIVG